MENEIWKIRIFGQGSSPPTSKHDNAPSGYLMGLMGHENRKAPDSNYRRKRRLRSPLILLEVSVVDSSLALSPEY